MLPHVIAIADLIVFLLARELSLSPSRRAAGKKKKKKKKSSFPRKVDGQPAKKMHTNYFNTPMMLLTIHERPPHTSVDLNLFRHTRSVSAPQARFEEPTVRSQLITIFNCIQSGPSQMIL